ncbi:hypothetical protein DUNSADRAFT_17874 [Dunaliella salina]|uniref:Uncharacterized protein n=1 Tax=Dunaliella salina TaxID=3046 RepID=A0ABQ7G127_DUNSA|nr:hypothetical protein DUNSADRAFT_17874 [Dunaliella salina]|eukprot:KAF5828266.1 hypothetical protein DUNSADRAFT_17874 [Dunaliella salina]
MNTICSMKQGCLSPQKLEPPFDDRIFGRLAKVKPFGNSLYTQPMRLRMSPGRL